MKKKEEYGKFGKIGKKLWGVFGPNSAKLPSNPCKSKKKRVGHSPKT